MSMPLPELTMGDVNADLGAGGNDSFSNLWGDKTNGFTGGGNSSTGASGRANVVVNRSDGNGDTLALLALAAVAFLFLRGK